LISAPDPYLYLRGPTSKWSGGKEGRRARGGKGKWRGREGPPPNNLA